MLIATNSWRTFITLFRRIVSFSTYLTVFTRVSQIFHGTSQRLFLQRILSRIYRARSLRHHLMPLCAFRTSMIVSKTRSAHARSSLLKSRICSASSSKPSRLSTLPPRPKRTLQQLNDPYRLHVKLLNQLRRDATTFKLVFKPDVLRLNLALCLRRKLSPTLPLRKRIFLPVLASTKIWPQRSQARSAASAKMSYVFSRLIRFRKSLFSSRFAAFLCLTPLRLHHPPQKPTPQLRRLLFHW